MKTVGLLSLVAGAALVLAQQPPPTGRTQGPGVQSASDPREPEVLKTCKTPPPGRGGGRPGGGAAKGGAPKGGAPRGGPAAAAAPRDTTVREIPGVIAAGAMWKEVWMVDGNNADGIVGTKDGGLLIAQNDDSKVIKLDKNGKSSVAYDGLNTSGSVAMNSKGMLFVANRGLNPSIDELSPKRQTLASKYMGDPMDCIGGVLNDIVADSKGGVYFTMGTVFYADSKGNVSKYGMGLNTNGIMLAPDEKHLYVTNAGTLVAFDVASDGSLSNQHEFAKFDGGGGDGSTFDAAGRFYVTANAGIQVIAPDGKLLGVIPVPRGVITVAFSGKDRKTLYAVSRDNALNRDWIIAIPMIAQGAKGRGK